MIDFFRKLTCSLCYIRNLSLARRSVVVFAPLLGQIIEREDCKSAFRVCFRHENRQKSWFSFIIS